VWRLVDATTGYLPMALVAGVLVLGLVVVRRRREAVLTAVSFAGALAVTTLLKHVVERSRPDDLPRWAEVSSYSFPSGHATATAAVAVAVVLVARRPEVLALAVALVGVAGWAQVTLRLHHPSDVVAGWLVAMTWTAAVWWGWGRPDKRSWCRPRSSWPPPARPTRSRRTWPT
jgi:undecaprenyl-diphosphatase